jgi:hypothetical protein
LDVVAFDWVAREHSGMMNNEKPIGIALIICDRVITDATTHEKTIVGTFNYVFAKSFPCAHPRMTIFVAITSGQGTANAEIKCVNESDQNSVMFAMKGVIPFKNPNDVVELAFQFNNVTFAKPGLHSIEFLCDGELILHRRFQVAILKPTQTP